MLTALDLDTLPPAAQRVARGYLDSRWGASYRSPAAREAWEAMQAAYVAYVAAYERAYPREAGYLPDPHKGQSLPEFAAFRAAREHAERLNYA